MGGVGQFDEVLEVFDGGVAAAFVEVAHEGGAVGGGEHGVGPANDHVALRVACVLREDARRAGLHDLAAHAAREAHALALDVGAGVLQDLQRLRVVAEIDADFFQDGVGVVFDDGQAFFAHHLKAGDLAGDVGHRLAAARGASGAFGLTAAPGTAAACDGRVGGGGV